MALRNTPGGPDVEFARFVRTSVIKAIKNGPRTFGDLLRDLPSIYPTDVLAEMDRMSTLPGIDSEVLARIRTDATVPHERRTAAASLLPLPHPLDFEWRFSDATCRELLVASSEMTRKGDTILLYGTPGVAYAAISIPVRHRRIVFAGGDNAVSRRLVRLNEATGRPISTLVGRSVPSECAAAVVVDPPWYPDYLHPMFRDATKACCSDGVVLASLPPLGIRPGAAEERDAFERFTERQGLHRVDMEGPRIAYETPFFEDNALATVGIYAPAVWRIGDPAVYRRRRVLNIESCFPESSRESWAEVEIEGMRIRIRMDSGTREEDKGLQSLVQRDVLPSVSRRDPRRAKANVWTSGNRVYRAGHAGFVLRAARACCQGGIDRVARSLWRSVEEEEALAQLMDRLQAIASAEAEERACFARGIRSRFGWAA